MTSWQDAPVVSQSKGKWQDAPVVEQGQPGAYADSTFAQATSGLNEGIGNLLGTPVDLATLALNAGGAGLNAALGTDIPAIEKPFLGSESIKGMMGEAIKPPTDDPTKQMIRRIGEEFGSAAIPVAGFATRAAQPLRMLGTELALTAGSGTGAAVAEQMAPDNVWAELAGQILGAGAASGVVRGVRKVITPNTMSPERQAAVGVMQQEGVDLTAGQQTGNKRLQYLESELGGARISDLTEQQAEQFTSAALRRAGINGRRATSEVLDDGFRRLGQDFDGLAARNGLPLDQQLGRDLQAVIAEYQSLVPDSMRAPVVDGIVNDLVSAAQGGNIVQGTAYQALRSRLDRMARAARSDPQLSDALFGVRNALDDAVERYMAQNNPDDLGLWREVRNEYRNILVIERAATGAGENAALGLISPAALRQAATSQNRRAYARGTGDFAELAKAGVATMSPLPQSGTAPRLGARTIASVPAAIGAALGSPGGFPGIAAGAVAGAVIPSAVGRALLSRAGRRYLANQAFPVTPVVDPRGIGPVSGMIASQSSDLSEIERAIMARMAQRQISPVVQ